jgi:hypothetical protein
VKNCSEGLGAKDNCADEGQYQFPRPDHTSNETRRGGGRRLTAIFTEP